IGSTIDNEGNYVAGTNNNLFSPATDVVNVLEQTSGNEASATVTVAWQCFLLKLYGEDPETIKLLRNFRDHVLIKTPEGREIIRLYYELSPFMVKTMEKDGAFKDEVRTLVEGILPLIALQ
ncbi:MAG: CFI-box-CTERM domain-containing protein, partial [Planctomycetota bacterium]